MNRVSLVTSLVLVLLAHREVLSKSPNVDGNSVSIPLETIWAYYMPGTRDVRELEPKPEIAETVDELARQSDVWKILKVLGKRPVEGQKAGPAFVVDGVGTEALKNASAVLSANDKDWPVFAPAGTDLTLVFYSYECGRYVHLVNVERMPGLITVEYQIVRHPEQIMSSHFALIPLGSLPKGTVRVNIKQVAPALKEDRWVPAESKLQRLVSGSFSFTVQ